MYMKGSNNTNKLSPQELSQEEIQTMTGSNNTNKLSPQELSGNSRLNKVVQIIQINLVLKNISGSLQYRVRFK
mgnify:CR=1 FL=1